MKNKKEVKITKFNNGKPYHGSDKVKGGKLKGATDTDYFYFFCPKCPDQEIMETLEWGDHRLNGDGVPSTNREFTIVFKLHCKKCKLTDFVKIGNGGWKGGQYAKIPGLQ
ncbi:hypothetical protein KJ885_05225 [Patescibacteria group bacterium]|nr:hypothetical protein [Patescibacteria group bacterium]